MNPTTEYAAQLPNKVIYMHDFRAPVVQAFVKEYGCGLTVVERECVGDSHGAWVAA